MEAPKEGADRGGRIETDVGKVRGVGNSGEMVVIDGFCVSACTIVLGTIPHDRICVISRAELERHCSEKTRGMQITVLRMRKWVPRAAPHIAGPIQFSAQHFSIHAGYRRRRNCPRPRVP